MIAGTLLSLAGTAASGLMSYFNNKKAQQQADAEAARQQAFYEAKANENPLSRSENQHLLGQYDRQAQQQIENARGVAAITGATPEYGLAVQKAVANGRADLMGNMTAGASERADKYSQLGEEARHQKALDDQARIAARNETFANLATNAANIVGSSIDGLAGAKKAPAEPSVGGGQSTSDKIKSAPSRAAQFQAGAEAATSPVEKQVLTDTGNAAANAEKLATATPTTHNQLAQGSSAQLTDQIDYVDNGDGTFSKDGVKYYRNFDGSYTRVN